LIILVVRRALRLALVVARESYSFGDLRQEHGSNKCLASRCSAAAASCRGAAQRFLSLASLASSSSNDIAPFTRVPLMKNVGVASTFSRS